VLAALVLGACAKMIRSERNVGAGALGAAALGTLIGSFTGDAGRGALIGTGVGSDYLYKQPGRSRDRAYHQSVQDSSR
jgi:hypothetical protein